MFYNSNVTEWSKSRIVFQCFSESLIHQKWNDGNRDQTEEEHVRCFLMNTKCLPASFSAFLCIKTISVKRFKVCNLVTSTYLFCKTDKTKKNVQNKDIEPQAKINESVDLEIMEQLHNSGLNNSKNLMCEDEQSKMKTCCTNNEIHWKQFKQYYFGHSKVFLKCCCSISIWIWWVCST